MFSYTVFKNSILLLISTGAIVSRDDINQTIKARMHNPQTKANEWSIHKLNNYDKSYNKRINFYSFPSVVSPLVAIYESASFRRPIFVTTINIVAADVDAGILWFLE